MAEQTRREPYWRPTANQEIRDLDDDDRLNEIAHRADFDRYLLNAYRKHYPNQTIVSDDDGVIRFAKFFASHAIHHDRWLVERMARLRHTATVPVTEFREGRPVCPECGFSAAMQIPDMNGYDCPQCGARLIYNPHARKAV